VPATLVTQWVVEDASARDLVVEFHRQLKNQPARPRAELLRQAALKVMQVQRRPQAWAGFILIGGDGR
jgi:CHAT domain-containing protein